MDGGGPRAEVVHSYHSRMKIQEASPDEKNRGDKRDPILKDHAKQRVFLNQMLQVCVHAQCATPRPLRGWRKFSSGEHKIRLYEESLFDRKSVGPSKPEHEEHDRERQYDEDPKE